MKFKNQTIVSGFLLLGLTDDPELQPLIFCLFLLIYLVTILGNLLIILAISSHSHLHTPMYFFLSSLSFTDICTSTTTIPKMLMNIQTQDQSITYIGCLTQSTSVFTFGGFESCLLAVMAYDRYVAICQPLSRIITNMEVINQTSVSEFNLLGLTDDPELQPLIFSLFLSIYLVTILGNLLIILAVSSESDLHTPMYFLLSNLSFSDICSSTSTIPKMLMNTQKQRQRITYTGCFTQAGFVLVFAFLESFLLAVMAYDRYAAICHPLRYTVIMNPHFCVLLVLVSLLISMADSLLPTLMALWLSFCTDLDITHFFCELAQVIKLACSDTIIDNILIYISSCICAGILLSGIIYSYIHIVSSVLRMSSSGGKYKAFSTCVSHLSVVSLFYGTGLGVYISSAVTDSPNNTAVASVMYSVLPQVLNPFIYSLRNKDMKEALWRLSTRKPSLL
ncbi:Olfactory receptor 7G2 [Fukomys damarensis]|uniref:Olfactory receptor 7G2 n=1 Tax=Fukomys damarensis TaxID=885580 RepID=A0A091E5N1_FUKDA|nr:Olfactory receptor 7G2 [Fukomys damarensis]